jgi:hypothetical protein
MELLSRSYGDEHGLIQEFRLDDGNFAVIDTDGDAVTINWSTGVRATEFLYTTRMFQDLEESHVTLGLGNDNLEEATYAGLEQTLGGFPDFDWLCNFLRLDVSETRTFEWQSLFAPQQMPLAGVGDSVASFRDGRLHGFLYDFIAKTVKTDALFDPIMKSLDRLDLL